MLVCTTRDLGFPGGSDGKESTCNVGDLDSIPGSGRSPGEGNGNPLQNSIWRRAQQYFCVFLLKGVEPECFHKETPNYMEEHFTK